jgi:hypothetical protein
MSLNERIKGIALPKRMQRLALDRRGFPIPWFVSWLNGEPDFRGVDPRKIIAAQHAKRCWICGQPLSAKKAFTIAGIDRIASHRDCALYAVEACPFLADQMAEVVSME